MSRDYSEYQLTPHEKRLVRLRDTEAITFKVFRNTAAFSPDEKIMRILVDDSFEEVSQLENLEEYERIECEHRDVKPDILSPEDMQEREEQRVEGLEKNARIFADLSGRFQIDRSIFDNYTKNLYMADPDMKEVPLYNVLSGAYITLQYGEGMLDFIYADFDDGFRDAISFSMFITALAEKEAEAEGIDVEAARAEAKSRPEPVEKVYSQVQDIVDEYFAYTGNAIHFSPIIYRSLYTAICPPAIKRDHLVKKALDRYYDYVRFLQEEYKELLEFCFDPDFWPEVLGPLHAVERYLLHQRIYDLGADIVRTERFDFDMQHMSGHEIPYGLTVDELKARFGKAVELTPAHKEFAKQFGLTEAQLKMSLKLPHFLNIRYGFRSLAELLQLEFSKMLEANIRLKKDSETGRYTLPQMA